MYQLNPHSLYRVLDGVVYDTEDASLVHLWQGRRGKIIATLYIMGITSGGNYFITAETPSFLYGSHRKFRPLTKKEALELTAEHDAPDSVLESLGVKVADPDDPGKPYDPSTARTVLSERIKFGQRSLLKNRDGRFLMYQRRKVFGVETSRTSPMSQREAIAWALKNDVSSNSLEMLGVSLADPMKVEVREERVFGAEVEMATSEKRAHEAEVARYRERIQGLKIRKSEADIRALEAEVKMLWLLVEDLSGSAKAARGRGNDQ